MKTYSIATGSKALADAKVGDIVFAHSKDLFGRAIRLAEMLRWKQGSYWNHTALVSRVDETGVWCLQMGRVCEEVLIADVAPGGQIYIANPPATLTMDRVMVWARIQLGIKYAVLTIVSIFINLFTPGFVRVDFRRGTPALICSGYLARSYEHGGWNCPYDPFQTTPAQLAMLFSIPPKGN